MCPNELFKEILIEHKGGMGNNYDFIVRFLGQLDRDTNLRREVHSVIVEFKHNCNKVNELPQFLELYDKDCVHHYDLCHVSYAEYYYNHFLDDYMTLDSQIVEPKPFKDTYLKYVYDIKYKHPFLRIYTTVKKLLRQKNANLRIYLLLAIYNFM